MNILSWGAVLIHCHELQNVFIMLSIPKGISLIQHPLPIKNYFPEEVRKLQIVVHHTASGDNAARVIDWWANRLNGNGTIATCIVIDRSGIVHQAFPSKFWAHNTGRGSDIDRHVVAIEMTNWGRLSYRGGTYRSYHKKVIPPADVVKYSMGFRGGLYYQKYTEPQITSLVAYIKYFAEKYSIDASYDYRNFFDISIRANRGLEGLYSHVSFKSDKSDCHPQPELIDALNLL